MQYVDQLPLPVPSRTDPTNFSPRADNFLGALPEFASDLNALATEVNAIGTEVEADKIAAEAAASSAQGSAFAASGSANLAAANAGAQLWVSGTTYSVGVLVYSPLNARTYRRKIAGAGTTDPSLDSTNWTPVINEVQTGYPNSKPTLNLDFANSKVLDSRITFARNSTANYYDGKTYFKAEENILTYSEDFSNAIWTKNATTVTSNSTIDPFGLTTADTLVETATTAAHYIIQEPVSVVSGNSYTFSIYVKYNTKAFVQLGFSTSGFASNSYANFNIQTGVLGTVGAGTTANIVSAGNGWYRCSITCVSNATNSSSGVFVTTLTSATSVRLESFAGSTSNSVYLFGADLEQSSTLGAYTPTTTLGICKYQMKLVSATANQPRFDHDPITGESKGFLLEEVQTNALTYSEDFTNAVWEKSNVSILNNNAALIMSPDGTLSAQKLIENTSNSSHNLYKAYTATNGVTYTFSIYAKASQRRYLWAGSTHSGGGRLGFDLIAGIVLAGTLPSTNARIEHVGNGWYRCSFWFTATASASGYIEFGLDGDASPTLATYPGDGYSGVYIWGAQLEDASKFPSSYIKTTASTATRLADYALISGTNFFSWFNQAEGSFVTDFTPIQDCITSYYSNYIFSVSDTTNFNRIDYRLDAPSNGPRYIISRNNTAITTSNPLAYSLLSNYVSAISYGNNSYKYCHNSANYEEDTNMSSAYGMQRIVIGTYAQNNASARGWLKRLTYYPKSLSQSEMQSVTAL